MDQSIKNKYGHCRYGIEKDYVHIYDLFIIPEFRGAGKAKDILQTTIDVIRSTGHSGSIQILVFPKEKFVNIKRLRLFYEKMGLEVFECYGIKDFDEEQCLKSLRVKPENDIFEIAMMGAHE